MASEVSFNWVDGIVRCPLLNTTAMMLPDANASLLVASTIDSTSPSGTHLLALLAASSGASAPNDASFMPFASTTLLYAIIVAQTLLSVVLLAYKFHGLRLLVARGASDDGDDGAVPPRVVRLRSVTPATDNRLWMLYFGSNCLGHAITVLVLQAHVVQSNVEAMRVLTLLQRCLLGCNCLALALALNHQRIHRVKEHRRQKKVSPELLRQVSLMNRGCAGLFFVFIVTDFIRSHIVDALSTVSQYFYWAYVAMLGVLSIPLCVAVLWLLCNEAPIQAGRTAKAMVAAGTAIHLVVMLPPTMWNRDMFGMAASDDVAPEDACPLLGGRMSRYDLVVLANVCSLALLFGFAVLEHSRNRAIGQTDYYHHVAARLNGNRSAMGHPSLLHGSSAPTSSQASELGTMLCEEDIVEIAIDDLPDTLY